MKKSNLVLASLAAAVLLSSCSSNSSVDGENKSLLESLKEISASTNYEVKEINGLYSMKIPDFMTSSSSLNDDASLQYNNLYKEKYIIVIDENKQEFVDAFKEIEEYDESMSIVDNYASVQLQYMAEAGTIIKESELKNLKINGMQARMRAIDANIAGVAEPISYWLGYVEGKENMYTIMAWTLESRKDSYEAEANEMIKSIREL